jgi:cellulose synthase/poly-beta-1,6-N-acetylglucosamine synthase-like glycosyltransferase
MSYDLNDIEVIVVDDGSSNPAEEIVRNFEEIMTVRSVHQYHGGPAMARNSGALEARGAYLAFTDDDCRPSPDWLRKLEHRFRRNADSVIAGRTVNDLSDNPHSTASQLILDFLFSYYNVETARFLTSNNMALSKELYRAIGGFDVTFPLAAAEDREFCDRCIYKGYKTLYASEAVVHHAHALSLRKFIKQHFNYGRGAHHFHSVRALRNQGAMRVEPLAFYGNLILYPWKNSGKDKLFLTCLIIIIADGKCSRIFLAKIDSSCQRKSR